MRVNMARRMFQGVSRILLFTILCGTAYVFSIWRNTPDVRHLKTLQPSTTALLLLREKERNSEAHLLPAEWVPLEGMSLLACAVVKAEDRMFFRHGGFDWSEVRSALNQAWRTGRIRGASTISAQLGRTLFLSPERSIDRKLKEVMLVRRLEDELTKARILELYLNTIEWGDGLYGATAASRAYFNKTPATLDAFEAVALASLIAAPRSPLVGDNLTRFTRVHARVLRQLYRSGFITKEEFDTANSSRHVLFPPSSSERRLADYSSLGAVGSKPERLRELSQFLSEECGSESESGNR